MLQRRMDGQRSGLLMCEYGWVQRLCGAPVVLLLLSVLPGLVQGQMLDVTFRFVRPVPFSFERVYLPGEFNGWGPNANGVIAPDAPSQMSYDPVIDEYLYTARLSTDRDYQYKVHFHFNQSGSEGLWVSDPYNPRTNPNDNNNSVVTVRDPMVFQLAGRDNGLCGMDRISASVFGSEAIRAFELNGRPRLLLPQRSVSPLPRKL
jgi:hypothetical protein